jgi:2-methylcitrate dehydratase PrpD
MGIAGSMAAGSLEFLHSDASTKQLHPGLAAQAALTAVELAAAGTRGPATILEGRYGLFGAYLGQAVPTSRLTRDLGSTWEVEHITLKPYPVCQLSHATLDAVSAIRGSIDLDRVTSITARVPSSSVPIVCEPRGPKVAPTTAYEAKFSLPWCAAAMLIDGDVTLETFADVCARADIAALATRIRCEGYEYDDAPATAAGEVTFDVVGERGIVSTAAAGRVLSDFELLAKFVANAGPGSESVAVRWLHLAEEAAHARP